MVLELHHAQGKSKWEWNWISSKIKMIPDPRQKVCPEIPYLSLVLMFDPAAKLLKCRIGPMGYPNIRILPPPALPRLLPGDLSQRATFHTCTVFHFHISHNSTRNCSQAARKRRIIFLFKDSDLTVLHLMRLCMFYANQNATLTAPFPH